MEAEAGIEPAYTALQAAAPTTLPSSQIGHYIQCIEKILILILKHSLYKIFQF